MALVARVVRQELLLQQVVAVGSVVPAGLLQATAAAVVVVFLSVVKVLPQAAAAGGGHQAWVLQEQLLWEGTAGDLMEALQDLHQRQRLTLSGTMPLTAVATDHY